MRLCSGNAGEGESLSRGDFLDRFTLVVKTTTGEKVGNSSNFAAEFYVN